MKIRINKDVVEFTPEHAAEAAELEALWVKMGNCTGATNLQEKHEIPVIRAPYDTDVYCVTCNKTQHVKAGEPIPFCCGRLMEILD